MRDDPPTAPVDLRLMQRIETNLRRALEFHGVTALSAAKVVKARSDTGKFDCACVDIALQSIDESVKAILALGFVWGIEAKKPSPKAKRTASRTNRASLQKATL